ncbi:MAG: DUF4446 family protein [Armatimonadetes bacterium]|nr:DUF4446 family protein [Armatimonadota bacterium]
MENLLRSLDKSPGAWVAGLSVIVLAQTAVLVWTVMRQKKAERRWAALMQGSGSENLESLLQEHLHERSDLLARLNDAGERIDVLERKMRTSKRYLGLVNYDAFDDVGGSQSFSMALYDEEGNGAVVTSQVGREGCRVYGKALVNGTPDRHLSAEEERALDQATSPKSRPRISP